MVFQAKVHLHFDYAQCDVEVESVYLMYRQAERSRSLYDFEAFINHGITN